LTFVTETVQSLDATNVATFADVPHELNPRPAITRVVINQNLLISVDPLGREQ
jgi:hypothetical protein